MSRIAFCFLLGITLLSDIQAQNLNTTFRSKMTFPGQTLANIWGYTARSGKEYALLGGAKGLIIVDISNPDTPQQIVQIPGPNNLWKEIKTYSHYAYITSEGGSGIQVVNLKDLPSPNLPYHFYRGDGPILNQLNKIHALHIDKEKGFLYAWGGDLFNGGAKVFDLKQDPYNPVYVGKYNQLGYIHDGYVGNDTMYSSHIYAGQFAIVNMANKNAPELIATQTTPGAFTHNTWITDDHKTILTTDEVSNSFLAAYDISDPTDIKFLDKIQSNPGSNSIVHNTYVLKNWAITSWYKDGFTIVDITRPDNMVQVGDHDTYPAATGSGFDGAWGVYPYFPSGTIVVSNINAINTGDGELWVVTPEYHRACYLEGKVTDGLTGNPLNNVKIEILGTNPVVQEFTGANGIYKMGQSASGYFDVKVSKNGYKPFETTALFVEGEVINLNVALFQLGDVSITGTVYSQADNLPVQGATVWLYGQQTLRSTLTNIDGQFNFTAVGPGYYDLIAEAPGLGTANVNGKLITDNIDLSFYLSGTYHRPIPGTQGLAANQPFSALENPFANTTTLQYRDVPAGAVFSVVNSHGQLVQQTTIQDSTGQIAVGSALAPGVYFARLENAGASIQVIKLVKTN